MGRPPPVFPARPLGPFTRGRGHRPQRAHPTDAPLHAPRSLRRIEGLSEAQLDLLRHLPPGESRPRTRIDSAESVGPDQGGHRIRGPHLRRWGAVRDPEADLVQEAGLPVPVEPDPEPPFMDPAVMGRTEEDQVVQGRLPALGPVSDVMCIHIVCVTPREAASPIRSSRIRKPPSWTPR